MKERLKELEMELERLWSLKNRGYLIDSALLNEIEDEIRTIEKKYDMLEDVRCVWSKDTHGKR